VGIALDSFDESSEKDANGTGSVLVFVNLAYSRIDPAVADGSLLTTTGSAQSTTGSAFWNFDDATGRLNFVTPLNLNNFDIVGVRAIRSAANQWSIDEGGRLIADEIKANKLCVGTTCVDEPLLKRILNKLGEASVSEIVNTPAPEEAPEEAPAAPEPEPSTEEEPAPSEPMGEEVPPPTEEPAPEEIAPPVVEQVEESAPETSVETEPTPEEQAAPIELTVSSNE